MSALPVVLLVEDDPSIRAALTIALDDAGFHTVTASDGASALTEAERTRFALAIVDVRLPAGGPDGLGVTRELRSRWNTPVILLTAADTEAARLSGFDAGADDYVVKPFGVPELLARIRALLRRAGTQVVAEIDLGDGFLIDVPARRVVIDGQEPPLTRTEFDLLVTLATSRGRVVPRLELLDRVWGFQAYNENVIEVHLSGLRRKLGPAHRDLIQTVRGVGYRIDR